GEDSGHGMVEYVACQQSGCFDRRRQELERGQAEGAAEPVRMAAVAIRLGGGGRKLHADGARHEYGGTDAAVERGMESERIFVERGAAARDRDFESDACSGGRGDWYGARASRCVPGRLLRMPRRAHDAATAFESRAMGSRAQ